MLKIRASSGGHFATDWQQLESRPDCKVHHDWVVMVGTPVSASPLPRIYAYDTGYRGILRIKDIHAQDSCLCPVRKRCVSRASTLLSLLWNNIDNSGLFRSCFGIARIVCIYCFFFVYSYSHTAFLDYGGVLFTQVSRPQSAQIVCTVTPYNYTSRHIRSLSEPSASFPFFSFLSLIQL